MADEYPIPKPQAPLLLSNGCPTNEWWNYWNNLLLDAVGTDYQEQIDALLVMIQELQSGTFNVAGFGSVLVTGSDGNFTVQFVNDNQTPGPKFFYGTDDAGVKGWFLRDLATLADVDLITTPPITGDALVYDGTLWVPGAVLANPMTTLGDVITGDVGGVPKRLPVGANGDVLTVIAGEPAYAAPIVGMVNPMTTAGDIIYGGMAGAPTRLAAGTATYVLTSNGAGVAPSWQVAGGGGGSGVWGSITGTITAQTDLMQRFATASLLDAPFL
jgi:hypothetical protein